MRGKCYGCGSTDHLSAVCPHKASMCQHCQKPGHTSAVCMTRYLGQKPGGGNAQRVRASTTTAPTSPAPAPAPQQSMPDFDALTRQLAALGAKLNELTGDFGSG